MLTARALVALLGGAFLNLNMTTCRSPGEDDTAKEPESAAPARVDLPSVNTKDLSPREQAQWSLHVSELLSPCKNVPVSVAACIQEKRDCAACQPAAEYLVGQVKEGKTRGQVDAAYKERFSPEAILSIDITGSPVKGPDNAAITIVEWADFECPACRAASPDLDEVVKSNKDVRLVFKNFPLDMHEHAEMAARAAVAADRQGKFWEMHAALFESGVPLTEATLFKIAEELKLDAAQFKKDIRSEEVADRVAKDKQQADEVKLRATPTLFINGRPFNYGTDLKSGLLEWIELERKLVKSK